MSDRPTFAERVEVIDQLLFDAGVMLLSANTKAARTHVDRKITQARVELEKLRRGTHHE